MLSFAAKECMLPGEHNSESVCNILQNSVRLSAKPHDGGILVPGNRMFTWKPKGARLITLIKLDGGATAVYDHETDDMYFAAPCAMLAKHIPAGTSVLAQYAEDNIGGGKVEPRLLVFDVIAQDWKRLDNVCAWDRYTKLRRDLAPLSAEGAFLSIQWVGEYVCSKQVLDGTIPLPHEVSALLLLRDDTPGVVDVLPARA